MSCLLARQSARRQTRSSSMANCGRMVSRMTVAASSIRGRSPRRAEQGMPTNSTICAMICSSRADSHGDAACTCDGLQKSNGSQRAASSVSAICIARASSLSFLARVVISVSTTALPMSRICTTIPVPSRETSARVTRLTVGLA